MVGRPIFLVAVLSAATAQAQSFRDWQLVRAETECLLVQSLLSRSSGAMLAQIVLQREGSGTTLAARVPTGASLVAGIGYRVDGGAVHTLDWMHCDAAYCLAVRPLSDPERSALLRGREMYLGFRPLPDSRALQLPVSLMGVTAGWNALDDCAPQPE